MGDGKRLKEILDEKHMSVRKLALLSTMKPSTLYAIINKDSNIRFDYALRIANELGVDPFELCSAPPFHDLVKAEELYSHHPDATGFLDAQGVRVYMKSSLYPLMLLFGRKQIIDVDNLLTSFYVLDDEARQEIVDIVKIKLKNCKDPKREEEIKNIKLWNGPMF